MIELKNVSMAYGRNPVLLSEIDAAFCNSKLTALIGRNGTGKSTLLRALAGLEQPRIGSVEVNGKNIYRINEAERAKEVAYVCTTRMQAGALRCADVVAMGRAPYTGWTGKLSRKDREIVDCCLAQTGMVDFKQRRMSSLSDGEWQRVMIARALAQETQVIILDEPTSFLDIPNRLMLCHLLQKLAHESERCVIYSTHELQTALELADDIVLIHNKRLQVYEATSSILQTQLQNIFNL